MNLFLQNVLMMSSGILLASYYFYFLIKELAIPQHELFNVKLLVNGLVISLIIGFIASYLYFNELNVSRKIFIIAPMVFSLSFCTQTTLSLSRKIKLEKHNGTTKKAMTYAGYFGIIFMSTMPFSVFLKSFNLIRNDSFFQVINNHLVNVSFFLTFLAYTKQRISQSRTEYQILDTIKVHNNDKKNDSSKLDNFGLTIREQEISKLILLDLTYSEIAKKTFIVPKTVSKHASNIFKKTDCKNKKDFIKKFTS